MFGGRFLPSNKLAGYTPSFWHNVIGGRDMFRKFLLSAIIMYIGCVLIGYNVAVWLGFAIAYICTAFFCVGWVLVLQVAKNTEQQVEVANLPTCNRPAQCAKGMGGRCYSGLDCPDKGVAT